jgi:hypothetical protein
MAIEEDEAAAVEFINEEMKIEIKSAFLAFAKK